MSVKTQCKVKNTMQILSVTTSQPDSPGSYLAVIHILSTDFVFFPDVYHDRLHVGSPLMTPSSL